MHCEKFTNLVFLQKLADDLSSIDIDEMHAPIS